MPTTHIDVAGGQRSALAHPTRLRKIAAAVKEMRVGRCRLLSAGLNLGDQAAQEAPAYVQSCSAGDIPYEGHHLGLGPGLPVYGPERWLG